MEISGIVAAVVLILMLIVAVFEHILSNKVCENYIKACYSAFAAAVFTTSWNSLKPITV